MRPKRYIVWSTEEVDLRDPFQKKWYIKQVLTHGRSEDIAALDWDELERVLPSIDLPKEIAALWEDYFHALFEQHMSQEFQTKAVRRHESFAEFQLEGGGEETRVQIARDSPYRFANPIESDLGVKVNDYRDLVVDKLLAFYGRAEPRDAVDLFFILKDEDFWDITAAAGEKDPGFDLYWLAVALEKVRDYPDDISRWPVAMVKELDAVELKSLFLRLAREILDRIRRGG